MAYQTGTEASPTTLKSTIETFATTNGWTLLTDVLSKGSSNVRLTDIDADQMDIEGANNAAFTLEVCPQKAKIDIASTLWPVTYRMFSLGTPDFIAVVLQYSSSRIQMLWFGDITKYGTWTGGNWFGAAKGENHTSTDSFNLHPIVTNTNTPPGAPFWGTTNTSSGYSPQRASFVHAEIDGYIWPGAGDEGPWPSFPEVADPIHQRQPNVWNDQSVLLPMWLNMPRASSLYSPIGHVAHMRSIRIDNYDLGEIITLGSDKWMLFPWHQKNVAERDGPPGASGSHTGTFGVAISYDGP